MPLDYASIMAAGQGLVPDLRMQMMQQEHHRMMQDARQAKIADNQFAVQQKQHEFSRRQAFEQDMAAAVQSRDPRAISRLMLKYPEFADQLKPAMQTYSEQGMKANLTTLGTAYVRAQNGDFNGAADLLEARYKADLEAGAADEDTPRVIAALRSGDPQQQSIAIGTLGITMAAANPDKFDETYGKMFPSDSKTAKQKEYDWRVATFGKEAADTWLATDDEKFISTQAGGAVFRASDLMRGGGGTTAPGATAPAPQPKGGDQARLGGAGIEARAKQVVPGVVVTSGFRTPERNKAVGGKANSYHLSGQARDFVPPPGMSMRDLHAKLSAAFPGYDVINEGDHVHVEPGPGMGRGAAPQNGPVRVRTIQEANKLPKGTRYVTPDGQEFIR